MLCRVFLLRACVLRSLVVREVRVLPLCHSVYSAVAAFASSSPNNAINSPWLTAAFVTDPAEASLHALYRFFFNLPTNGPSCLVITSRSSVPEFSGMLEKQFRQIVLMTSAIQDCYSALVFKSLAVVWRAPQWAVAYEYVFVNSKEDQKRFWWKSAKISSKFNRKSWAVAWCRVV